ncbi:RAMP superfamily CRISPR-associated protein [Paralimibaculum aggregatum]|uniref:RAMP superfamily CRISPR-associated protein n=1 Tax=Paralimibaculum aggregatum TaxID=3036245 RepID=A0ABQ6LTG4_9RHOB|nr:RAMP superfamily CRISPR-associated protein [Limibaculum sp. NKW23]GMG85347.1 RAMP superfamily CRISPR-associated protein [Limibaculum sp. NKW23]
MMYGKRYRIESVLRLERDLHIGGSRRIEYRDENDERRERVAVMRARDGAPLIPASSLKGALRARLDRATEFLGEASEHKNGRGKAARLWMENAPASKGHDAPRCDKHVSIDRVTGAALENHLFEREMLPEGMTFAFAADWLSDTIDELAHVLAPLCQGICLGKGTSKGHGLLSLDIARLSILEISADASGEMRSLEVDGQTMAKLVRDINVLADATSGAEPGPRRIVVDLECEGPYISILKIGGDGESGACNVAQPLMRNGRPWMHPETLIGALRSRAAWLAEVVRARGADGNRADDVAMDDHKLAQALGGRRKVTSREEADRDLSWVEQLFGVTGWRSRLDLIDLRCTDPGSQMKLTSNSLDRVTGATRDGFLFARNAHWKPKFRATFLIRGCAPEQLDALLADIIKDGGGLELGHATTKGFGWFKVTVVKDSAKEPKDV